MICCGSNCCASCALFSRCTSCQTSGCRIFCLVRPGCFVCPWAAARPRDRHTRACGSEWSISRPALALPPPTGTATRPSGPSGALHTSGAGSLFGSSARRLEARPGPATAHGHRSQASRPAPHPSFLSPQPISHAIPLRLLQVLNSDRWNCNVFQTLSKLHPIELHATFLEGRH